MNSDEMKGKAEQLKGKVKQGVAQVTEDEELHHEGQADVDAGKVREGVGAAKRKVGETIEDIGTAIKR